MSNTKIIKTPGINGLSKTKGCEKAPLEILKILKEEIYSNEQGKTIEKDGLDIDDMGKLNLDNINEMNEKIYRFAYGAFENNSHQKKIFLGGDHSVSFSLSKAFVNFFYNGEKKNLKEEPCFIVFDAHPDLMPCVDKNAPTHEEWLRSVIEGLKEKGFSGNNVLLVGNRNSSPEELNYIKKEGIRTISLDRFEEDIDNIADTIMEFASGKKTYISIDIDVLDPAFVPGTYYKEPGGLTSRQLIYLIKRLNMLKNIFVVDLVEINPSLDDKNKNTVKTGAKILSEFL